MARAHLFGTPVSPGIAIGTIRFLHVDTAPEMRRILPSEVEAEKARLLEAMEAVREDLKTAMGKVPADMQEYREIIAAQVEMTRDPKLVNSTCQMVERELVGAAWALDNVVNQLVEVFRSIDDPYLKDRAQDVRVVGMRILNRLSGGSRTEASATDLILAAEDVSPADIMDLDVHSIRGIVTREGGITSHTAILARGMHIPALVCVTNLLVAARDGDTVIIDGLGGNVLISPNEEDTQDYSRREKAYAAWQEATRDTARWPADTKDALRVGVLANVEHAHEAAELSKVGADGIGLYRTEFAFLKESLPSEEELFEEYATVVRNAPGQVVIRTLDIGGDKLTRAQEALREANPALGLRGVRFTLHNQDIFKSQLRALLRAAAVSPEKGTLRLLLPMISMVEEVRAVKRLLQEVDQELSMRGIAHAKNIPLGVMIETPAAVFITDQLARECDFFSIGTNDLIHYLMAIDRNNMRVAYLAEAMHPAVIRSLKRIIDTGHREGLSVSACGELSSDPFGVVLMLGMGIDALSVSPPFLPGIKHLIRQLDAQDCTELATQVLLSSDIQACKHLVNEMLQKVLGHELAFLTSSVMGTRA